MQAAGKKSPLRVLTALVANGATQWLLHACFSKCKLCMTGRIWYDMLEFDQFRRGATDDLIQIGSDFSFFISCHAVAFYPTAMMVQGLPAIKCLDADKSYNAMIRYIRRQLYD